MKSYIVLPDGSFELLERCQIVVCEGIPTDNNDKKVLLLEEFSEHLESVDFEAGMSIEICSVDVH